MILPEGTLLANRYRLERRLGAGAMGAVYKARDETTGRDRAVKVMHAHTLDREDLRARFAQEATITGRIRSPYVVDVLDAGVDEGTPYFVMELLQGEDLSRRLKSVGRFSAEEALLYLAQTAAALDETHRAGIVHRDLKPANLFLENRPPDPPRVRVLDFGVAKVIAESAGHATAVAGTPTYMAPEQLRGRKVSPATDIYALGMIAFTFLTGSTYWEEERDDASNTISFALLAMDGPREPASRRAERRGVELPAGFDPWFARATAVDPDARFHAAGAAIMALSEALSTPISLPSALSLRSSEEEEKRSEYSEMPSAPDSTAPGADTLTGTSEEGREGRAAGHRTLTGPPGRTFTASRASQAPPASLGPSASSARPESPEPSAAPPASLRPEDRSAGGAPRRSGKWRSLAIATGVAALVGAGVLSLGRDRPPMAKVASPLDAKAGVLACPVFEVRGVDEPSGWLGAAAAATFCERARVLLGGATARTLVPAELLGLPVELSDNLPEDPYASPDARARSIEEAKRRGVVYADGRVTRETSGFRVEVALLGPNDEGLGRADGRGRALYEAIRDAMAPLVRAGTLPKAPALDPTIAQYTRAPDIDGALSLLDLSFAMVQNAGALPDECRSVKARSAEYAELGPGEQYRCAYTLGHKTPRVELPPSDPASPGAMAARARVRLMALGDSDVAAATELARMLKQERSGWGQSTLAATTSCLVQASDPEKARDLALQAVRAEPKNPSGEWCEPWIQAAMVTRGTASADATLRALRAWAPWEGYGWLLEATSPGQRPRALEYARRAYVLSPLDAYVADVLADRLLSAGDREQARAVALAIAAGGHPVHQVESELLLVRIAASEARFGGALSRALSAMVVSGDDAGWVRVQRLEIGWRALQIGLILGRAQEIADLLVERFIDPEPSPLDGAHIDVPLRLPAICARASRPVARRCFERFRVLRGALSLGALPDTDAFTEGAERYAAGDLSGAAKAWRPLMREPGPHAALLVDAMLDAFERAGDKDLALRLSAAVKETSDELNGASLATVRAARRAAKQGDRRAAQTLAKQVIDAWSVADETVPAVEEMRRLIERSR